MKPRRQPLLVGYIAISELSALRGQRRRLLTHTTSSLQNRTGVQSI